MTAPSVPIEIRHETERYFVRPLTADDASERVGAWLADPHTARMLNAPARVARLDELRKYFTAHDGIKTHILGMFDKASGKLLGVRSVYIDWNRREFLVNALVGERGPGGAGVSLETARPLLHFLFEELDLLCLRASVLARNEKVERQLAERNIVPEHVSFKPSVHEAEPEKLHHYSITREQYRQLVAARLERERLDEAAGLRKAS